MASRRYSMQTDGIRAGVTKQERRLPCTTWRVVYLIGQSSSRHYRGNQHQTLANKTLRDLSTAAEELPFA